MTENLPAHPNDLSGQAAKAITIELRARYKTAAEFYELAAQAKAGRVWLALGMKSWRAYTETEFGITARAADYGLMQVRVARELTAKSENKVPTSVVSRKAAQRLASDPKAMQTVVDTIVAGADPVEAIAAATTPEVEPEQPIAQPAPKPDLRPAWWTDDPQKALSEAVKAVTAQLGTTIVEKLLRAELRKLDQSFTDSTPTPVVRVARLACTHPAKSIRRLTGKNGALMSKTCGACGSRL